MNALPENADRIPLPDGPVLEEKQARSQAARVESIRGLVNSGDYEVPALAVAERMLVLISTSRRSAQG